jgi:hypothetical protein
MLVLPFQDASTLELLPASSALKASSVLASSP